MWFGFNPVVSVFLNDDTTAYRRVALPVLKLTKRPAVGQQSHGFAHGDILPPEPTYIPHDYVHSEETRSLGEEVMDHFPPSYTSEPTLHELERRASAAGWHNIRNDIVAIVTENAAMPQDQVNVL